MARIRTFVAMGEGEPIAVAAASANPARVRAIAPAPGLARATPGAMVAREAIEVRRGPVVAGGLATRPVTVSGRRIERVERIPIERLPRTERPWIRVIEWPRIITFPLQLRSPVWDIPDDQLFRTLSARRAVRGLPRAAVNIPISPALQATDRQLFEAAQGDERYQLPRYRIDTERVGATDELAFNVTERQDGSLAFLVRLRKGPAQELGDVGRQAKELGHLLAARLKYNLTVLGGGTTVKVLEFENIRSTDRPDVVIVELTLAGPGERDQLLATLTNPGSAATLELDRVIDVAVPASELNLQSLYRVISVNLDLTGEPAPIVISQAQASRLASGGSPSVGDGLIRHRIAWQGRSHSYYQDAARPASVYFLPDEFRVSRKLEPPFYPSIRFAAVPSAETETTRMSMEFIATPFIDQDRLAAAQPELEAEARKRGATGPVDLEILPVSRPMLRLALPKDGAPSSSLVDRPDANLDLDTMLIHAETLSLVDFLVIYKALFGSSLSLLRGEIRVSLGAAGEPDDVPFQARLDQLNGEMFEHSRNVDTGAGVITARLTNAIESPLILDGLAAQLLTGDQSVEARLEGVPAVGTRLAPGEHIEVRLTPATALSMTAETAVQWDFDKVRAEPDPTRVWDVIFDATAGVEIKRRITLRAFPETFAAPAGQPEERVVAQVVTFEGGSSYELNQDQLTVVAMVMQPLRDLLLGGATKTPTVRYRTEVVRQNGRREQHGPYETESDLFFPRTD